MTSKIYELKEKILALSGKEREELLASLASPKGMQSVPPGSIRLVKTCDACPEQYDAFVGETKVGYLRLRHGSFRVDVPDCGEETIFNAKPEGDGIFMDGERETYLSQARVAIAAWLEYHPEVLVTMTSGV